MFEMPGSFHTIKLTFEDVFFPDETNGSDDELTKSELVDDVIVSALVNVAPSSTPCIKFKGCLH